MTGLLGVPRVRLGTFPTPLVAAPRLSAAAGVEIWFKRDDLTGLGLGGNKVRGLEYLLADARGRGCDVLVTGGAPQSNWAMLAALAGRTRGMDTVLVHFGHPVEPVGNLALAVSAGAQVRFTGDDDRGSVDRGVAAVAAELAAAGRTPYAMGRGGATGVGALGYVAAGLELAGQLQDTGLAPAQLWLATGSCGTHAGLRAAQAWLRPGYDVVGVTVSRPAAEAAQRVDRIAAEASDLIGTPRASAPPVVVDGFLGPAKGARSPEGEAAAALVARTEGVFLDPVFAAKAMAGLLAAARDGTAVGPVVFLVSGGAPTLFL
ncbi:1-aminocyclopropane-1-carboxylate deaminase/D-cysteine desulfhydrase [Pseudonocardia hydrocarbonoxydans]|uniref:D-cysteine desulfhydrase n=1 Tax=Pseudonocardia hydrocarbonoxydans TaxID=76726 RepID=A0A4Y3WTA1_9PSEU|nr:pyridoxal-phosphate dependent enzyme [Pseudonocardia hydrocarbonoxydans]GEC21330.1 D-cysteine desulfhydrase [Pseudonocardia hydrocarbonoxydans]